MYYHSERSFYCNHSAMMRWLAFTFFYFSNIAFASGLLDLPPIGPHFEIFRLEKSENPENILVAYTRLDKQCRFFTEDTNYPVFDFYWLMKGKRYKPVNFILKKTIRDRLKVQLPEDFSEKHNLFSVQLIDLNAIAPSIQNSKVQVATQISNGHCQVISAIQNLELEKVYLVSQKTIWPPFRKVISLRLEGRNVISGIYEQKIFLEKN